MITVLGMPVTLWFVFLIVIGIILCMHVTHKEGFVGSGSGSGTYMTSLTPIYVKDCTTGTGGSGGSRGSGPCASIGRDTDRLLFFQRLYVGGKLISTNGRYILNYQPTGMLLLNDLGAQTSGSTTILWRSDTRGTSSDIASYLINTGSITARRADGTIMSWTAVPNPGGPSSGSGSGSGSASASSLPTFSIPGVAVSGAYLQVTDYGDLIVKASGGNILWSANAGKLPAIEQTDECIPDRMTYPFTQSDCYQINGLIKANEALLTSLATGISCEAGYYCDGTVSAMPTRQNICPSGTYCPVNSIAPTDCPAGQFSAAGAAECTNCPAGQSSEIGETSCFNCPAGQSSNAGGVCTACSPGYYCAGGVAAVQCPLGYYCPGGISVQCPAGTSSAGGTTAISISACENCPMGQTSVDGGLCTPCPGGKTSESGGQCFSCPAGQQRPMFWYPWSTPCEDCPTGQSSISGGQCFFCPPGQSSVSGGFCEACPPGTTSYGMGGPCVAPSPYYGY